MPRNPSLRMNWMINRLDEQVCEMRPLASFEKPTVSMVFL
jgi:hypothetical protein